jgi:hypothetical protein
MSSKIIAKSLSIVISLVFVGCSPQSPSITSESVSSVNNSSESSSTSSETDAQLLQKYDNLTPEYLPSKFTLMEPTWISSDHYWKYLVLVRQYKCNGEEALHLTKAPLLVNASSPFSPEMLVHDNQNNDPGSFDITSLKVGTHDALSAVPSEEKDSYYARIKESMGKDWYDDAMQIGWADGSAYYEVSVVNHVKECALSQEELLRIAESM